VDKEQIIEDFFRSFKVTLTNSFSYNKDHPYFIKSVESFKAKLEEALVVLNPFRIGITNSSVMVDGKNLIKVGFYDEIGRLLHQRKIKSLEIRTGPSVSELIGFFSVISMSPRDIFKNGGVSFLLKQQSLNLIVEELDYSALLQDGGQECTDIWGYMLKEVAESNDAEKLNKMADEFGAFIKRVNENDIIGSEEICTNINEFLTALKDRNGEKFEKCSKEIFLWLLDNKKSLDQEKIARLKPIFSSLSDENFSALLWEGLTQEDNFDSLSLELFSKISEQKDPSKIAEGVLNKTSQSQNLIDNPNVVRRIQNLLSKGRDDQVSAVYHNILASMIKGISICGSLFFNQKKLRENYRYIVLSMLLIDNDADNLKLAAGALENELSGIFEDNAVGFLKDLYELLVKRQKEGITVCGELEKKLSAFVENIILEQPLLPEQNFLITMVSSASHELDYYLDKIFAQQKANKQVMELFLKLFPGNLAGFYERLNQKSQDMEFLSSFIEALSQLDVPVGLEMLEYIYSSANELIKMEVLNVMRKQKRVDIAFLTHQLNTDSFPLRKNIYSVLILDAQAKGTALNLLFNIPGFFGLKNKLLMENMQIAYGLGFSEALKSIQDLSHRRFFWNRELRNKAKQILKEWNVF
jgi:hypothetical protein